MSYISRYSNIPSLPSIKKLPEKMEALSKYTEKLRSEGYATRDITASEFSLIYAQKKKELEIRAKAENKPYLLKENITRRIAKDLRVYTPKTVKSAAESVGMTVKEFKSTYKNKTTSEIWNEVGGAALNEDSSSEQWAQAREMYNKIVTG